MSWVIFVLSLVLALSVSPWWWAAVALSALFNLASYHRYKSRPWRRMHFPFMRAYAAEAGRSSAIEKSGGGAVSVEEALAAMLTRMPVFDAESARAFVAQQIARGCGQADEEFVRAEIKKKNPSSDSGIAQRAIVEMREKFGNPDSFLKIRFVCAGLVERQFGPAARSEYLLAIARGQAY